MRAAAPAAAPATPPTPPGRSPSTRHAPRAPHRARAPPGSSALTHANTPNAHAYKQPCCPASVAHFLAPLSAPLTALLLFAQATPSWKGPDAAKGKGQRVLIIGGDGYCGWATALHLSARGCVHALWAPRVGRAWACGRAGERRSFRSLSLCADASAFWVSVALLFRCASFLRFVRAQL
jgi:hypothetical protein